MRAGIALIVFFLLLLPVQAAKKRDWKQGALVSVDSITIPIGPHRVAHRYNCVVADGAFLYTVEYEDPLKAVVHDPIRFVIEKDWLVLLDSDGKERSARIEKRERAPQ